MPGSESEGAKCVKLWTDPEARKISIIMLSEMVARLDLASKWLDVMVK